MIVINNTIHFYLSVIFFNLNRKTLLLNPIIKSLCYGNVVTMWGESNEQKHMLGVE
jgi:hypothetical protein